MKLTNKRYLHILYGILILCLLTVIYFMGYSKGKTQQNDIAVSYSVQNAALAITALAKKDNAQESLEYMVDGALLDINVMKYKASKNYFSRLKEDIVYFFEEHHVFSIEEMTSYQQSIIEKVNREGLKIDFKGYELNKSLGELKKLLDKSSEKEIRNALKNMQKKDK